MTKKLLLILISCFAITLSAQLLDLSIVNQSAITPNGNIHLRMLNIEELSLFNFEALTHKNGQQNISSFVNINEMEQKTIIPAPDNNVNFIGFRMEEEMLNAVVPWQINDNQTNQKSMYIRAGVDSLSEENLNGDNILDLKYQSYALTENSLWVMLENVSGTYPNVQNYINAYIYGALIIKPEHIENLDFEDINFEDLSDLNAYAMINVNLAPLLPLTPGLYKVPLSVFTDPSSIDLSNFTSIGSISSSVNSQAMMMGVDFATLTADPDFGEWPSLTNSLITLPFIIKITNPVNPTFNYDFGQITLVYCSPYPVLEQNVVSPLLSYEQVSCNVIEITYSDPSGFYPAVAEFRSNNQAFPAMSSSLTFHDNASFTITIANGLLESGQIVFSNDSLNYVEIDFVPTSEAEQTISIQSDFFNIYPNPLKTESVNIEFKQNLHHETTITLFNIKGQKIRDFIITEKTTTSSINLSHLNLKSGIYFIQASNKSNKEMKKILILK